MGPAIDSPRIGTGIEAGIKALHITFCSLIQLVCVSKSSQISGSGGKVNQTGYMVLAPDWFQLFCGCKINQHSAGGRKGAIWVLGGPNPNGMQFYYNPFPKEYPCFYGKY
jgi:hypothetical protein